MTLSLISILKYSVSMNMHTNTQTHTHNWHTPAYVNFFLARTHATPPNIHRHTHILGTKVTLSSQVSQDRKRQREKEEKEMTQGKKRKKKKEKVERTGGGEEEE